MNHKIIFLTSSPSGPLDQSRYVDGLDEMNGFVEKLRALWPQDARCLMITASPDAFEQNDEMTGFFRYAVEKAGLSVSAFDLLDRRTPDISSETLLSYQVIFLGGGHVPTQNAYFHQLQLREKLVNYSGILIGISAGTMNCADEVYSQPEEPGEASDPGYQRFLTGLGLTKTQILPHYQMVKDFRLDGQRLFEDITYGDSYGRHFLALPDGSYLLSIDGQETVYGEAYVVADGGIRKICETDQSYDIAAISYKEELR